MTTSPLKTTMFVILGLSLGVGLLLGLMELTVRSLNALHLLPPTSLWEFRARQPAPYVGEDYFSADFLAESRRQPGGWQTPSGTTLVLPNNFSGQWFNVRNNQRVTVGQPDQYQHTLHLFGGSTIYNSEVPDNLTVASQLQALLNAQAPNTWRVENYGASTITAMQQLERLKTISLKRGDVVVFYDGVNDAVQGVFYNNPNGWMVGKNREQLQRLGWVAHLVRAQLWLRDKSALGALLLPAPDSALPPHLQNPATLPNLVAETTTRYRTALQEAARHAKAQGATFVHALQPQLFSRTQPTPYETELANNPTLVPAGMAETFAAAYPAFTQMLGAEKTFPSINLSGALANTPDAYLDFCHITGKGNAAVANAIFEQLQPKLSAAQSSASTSSARNNSKRN